MSKYQGQGQNPPLWVSQNFLTSHKTIERLLRRTTIGRDDHVIEIGPGKGHTTRLLLGRCRKVTAVELDERLYQRLAETFRGAGNLRLCCRDFLQWRLPAGESYKVFANIPFCHTTGILRKLAQAENPPAEAWLTMENGAAKRFLGKPRETADSLMLKPVFDMEITYYFCREDFHPMPGVDVVLVHLTKKSPPDVAPSQRRAYERFVSNGLRFGLGNMFSAKQLSRALREAGVPASGEMRYVQWLCLFRRHWEQGRMR